MAATLAEKLTNVQDAIERIEQGAQSHTAGGRTTNHPELSVLYEREQSLLNQIDRAGRGRVTVAET